MRFHRGNRFNGPGATGPGGLEWAIAHLSEREAVFPRTALLAATLAWNPGAVSVEAAERAVEDLTREGRLHAAPALEGGDGMTTDKASPTNARRSG